MTKPKLATARSGYGGRGYYIPGELDAAGGRRVFPSVTTVLKHTAKPGLIQWVADTTAAYAVENIGYLTRQRAEVAWRNLRFYWSRTPDLVGTEIRRYHEGVRDDAAELGTNIHEWIEAEVDPVTEHPALDSIEATEMAVVFQMWMEQHDVVVYETEFTVFSPEIGVAGTGDGLWKILCLHDGPPCLKGSDEDYVQALIDLKSSRYTWPEHGMQTAALAACPWLMREVISTTPGAKRHQATEDGKRVTSWWLRETMPRVEAIAALHIRPTDLDKDGNVMAPFCRLVDFTPNREVYLEGFKGALALTKMHKALGVPVEVELEPYAAHGVMTKGVTP